MLNVSLYTLYLPCHVHSIPVTKESSWRKILALLASWAIVMAKTAHSGRADCMNWVCSTWEHRLGVKSLGVNTVFSASSVKLWASYVTSLCLGFLICEIEVILVPNSQFIERI